MQRFACAKQRESKGRVSHRVCTHLPLRAKGVHRIARALTQHCGKQVDMHHKIVARALFRIIRLTRVGEVGWTVELDGNVVKLGVKINQKGTPRFLFNKHFSLHVRQSSLDHLVNGVIPYRARANGVVEQ